MVRQSTPAILLTRPQPQSERFAEAVRARLGPGIRIAISPLMGPVFHALTPPEDLAAVILTSETGVEAARRIVAEGQTLPRMAYCVGDHTAAQARAAGFEAISASGDAAALLALITAARPPGRLLHLRGRDSRGAVTDQLNNVGINVLESIAYSQMPLAPTPEATALLAGTDPVLVALFSARSAALFAELPGRVAPLWIAALSPAVMVPELSPLRLAVARHPDAAAMLDAVAGMLNAGAGA